MSIAVMTAVFKINLPPSEKVVALALADHSHDDGTEARPGLDSLAVKTSLSRRQVQRVVKTLVKKGILVVQREATPFDPVCYRFVLDSRGDILSTGDIDDDLGVTLGASRGDTHVTQTINEPSTEPSSLLSVEDARALRRNLFDEQFEQLWLLYPRKVGKDETKSRLRALVKAKVPWDELVEATLNYSALVAGTEQKYIKHPRTFFNMNRWKDYLNDAAGLAGAPKTPERVEQQTTEAMNFFTRIFGKGFDRPVENPFVEHLLQQQTITHYGRMLSGQLRDIVRQTVIDMKDVR